jgi:hypothetical protein
MDATQLRLSLENVFDTLFYMFDSILWQRPPWALFYDGQLAPDLEQLSRDIDTYVANYHAWRAWHTDKREQRRLIGGAKGAHKIKAGTIDRQSCSPNLMNRARMPEECINNSKS